MHAQYLFIDEGSYRQAIEAVRHGLPQTNAVATLALIVEAVNAIDAGGLVIAAQNEELIGVAYFEGQQQTDGFYGLFSTVDVVPQEQIVGAWWESTILEQPQQVVVLAVDIAYSSALGYRRRVREPEPPPSMAGS